MFRARHLFTSVVCLGVSFATCSAQTPATFKTQTYTQRPSTNPYAIDVNNDGIPDLVQQTTPYGFVISTFKAAFTVRIANGDGSFRAPAVYYFPPSEGGAYGGIPMVSGDFNGDGNVDLIFEGNSQLLLYLGNGDGTFQAPKNISVNFPSGQQMGRLWLTADFTGDGKLDLITTARSPKPPNDTHPESIYLIPGNGAGGFGAAISIDTLPVPHGGGDTDSITADTLLAGDFDGDGRADIAFVEYDTCDQGQPCLNTVHVLYNDGNSQFTDTTTDATIKFAVISINTAGDLNSDGRSDITATSYSSDTDVTEFYALYGQANRTFHMYTIPGFSASAMADFNGDTRMDLVGTAPNSTGTGNQLTFLLADSSEGAFTQQTYTSPNAIAQVVGDFNFDTRPDFLGISSVTTSTYVISDSLNTTPNGNWGGCPYPKAGMGIHVCAPSGSATTPVTFNASANSFGQLRKIELWVDGKKVTEQYHAWGARAWFNFSKALASGTHRVVFITADIDSRLQKTTFNITVK